MCFIAIPGQTGCLALRNVPPTRLRAAVMQTPGRIGSVLPRGETRFSGGTLVKKSSVSRGSSRQAENIRAQNAKQHSRVRPKRTTIRRFWFA